MFGGSFFGANPPQSGEVHALQGSVDATLAANLPDSTSLNGGEMWQVTVAGSFEDDASIDPASTNFDVGDFLIWNAGDSKWNKLDSSDSWEEEATKVWLKDTTKNLGVGTDTPTAKTHIKGLADLLTLLVNAYSGQTANIVEVNNHDDTLKYLVIDKDGNISVVPDTDAVSILGRLRVHSPTSDYATLSHYDTIGADDFALRIATDGSAILNTATGTTLYVSVGNSQRISANATDVTVNGGALDVDFFVKKLTAGNAISYDAGTDALALNSTTLGITAPADGTTLSEHPTGGTPLAIATYQTVVDLATGLLDLKGVYDASTNTPDLDTSPSGILKGDTYFVSVDGAFFTEDVENGDMLIALQDNPTTLAHWGIANRNIDDATTTTKGIVELATDGEALADKVVQGNDARLADNVKGPASATDEAIALFDGTTGKLLKDSGTVIVEQFVSVPSAYNDTGTKGQIAYGAGYLYICVATDTWVKHAVITSF